MRRSAIGTAWWCVLLLGAVLAACGGEDSTTEDATTTAAPPASELDPTTEELRFESGEFVLVGDIVLPGGEGPFPAVIAVHGSGSHDRADIPGYRQLRDTLLDAGFALFSWDTPGTGASEGTVAFPITERSAIVADAVDTLGEHPRVDAARIGLWGLSQAGWVMPKALEDTDEPAFMIVVSGGAEDTIEQTTYLVSRQLVCRGGSAEDGRVVEEEGARALKATTYDEYRAAAELVYAVDGVQAVYPFEVADEADWSPSPGDIESWFDPMTVVDELTIPVLAVFGELDQNVDPVQGAAAYADAFAAGGHELSRVETIPGVGHTMTIQETGCPGEPTGPLSDRYVELLAEWIGLVGAEL